nr:unnamed protein product [Callosobruchus analis]
MWKHTGLPSSNSKFYSCVQCSRTFNTKTLLDEHLLRRHPKLAALVSSKIHECTDCDYKSTNKSNFEQHRARGVDSTISTCTQCKAPFMNEQIMGEHVIKDHPNFIASISCKIYECVYCAYKTTFPERNCQINSSPHKPIKYDCKQCHKIYTRKITFDDHIVKKHPEHIALVSSDVLECRRCDYKTTYKRYLHKHKLKHPSVNNTHCNTKFKTKTTLFNHIVQNHPSFASSVTSKVYECSKCSYKTTRRYLLDRHLLNHADVTSKFQLSKCERCNVTFKGKQLRDAHILKEHPNFIGSVTSRIHECTNCNYKTTFKFNLKKHMLKHCSSRNLTCSQCDASFRSKPMLDNHCEHCDMSFKHKAALYNHVIKRHPETTDSIPGKILECSSCTYKTTRKVNLKKHELLHTDPDPNFTCMRCDATFRTMRPFGDHVIKHHPNFIASISCKVHECVHCEYKTTYANNFAKHLTEHTGETTTKLYPCKHCHAIFKSKQSMDDHVLRKHPDLIATVTSKLHTCKYCTYKTTLQTNLAKHVADHTEIFGKLFPCAHCVSSFKTKQSLDNHILKKHADFNSSVSCTVYQCDKCPYITAFRHCLTNHNCRNV